MRYSYMIIDQLETFGGEVEIRSFFAHLKQCGYDGVELNLREPSGVDLDQVQRWLADIGLSVPSFLTGEAYKEGMCLCSPDGSLRARAVRRLILYLERAAQFDAILVVGLLQGLRSDEADEAAATKRIADGLAEVAAAAVDKGVEFVVEPVNHLQVGFHNSVEEVRGLVAAVGSPALSPMVDTVHMNIEDPSITQPILDCDQSLRHVHLCESNGALFGTGHINFAAVLDTLEQIRYDRFASIKVYRKATHLEASSHCLSYLQGLGD
jgi:sugar phosphate isomerase/epimerase